MPLVGLVAVLLPNDTWLMRLDMIVDFGMMSSTVLCEDIIFDCSIVMVSWISKGVKVISSAPRFAGLALTVP